jgi:hypothetical protein
MHYQRWRHNGDPLIKGKDVAGYFTGVVLPYRGSDCLLWPYATNPRGYATITSQGDSRYVHRLACEAINGPPPTPEHEAAHRCGNGHLGCVTPLHLRWATAAENNADKIAHGTVQRGENGSNAKLTSDQVRRIRRLAGTTTQRRIAEMFGVVPSTISKIITHHNWSSLA